METKLSNLEHKILGSQNPDLSSGALVASGIDSRRSLSNYLYRIDMLCQQMTSIVPDGDEVKKAKALFDWLWSAKPDRYEHGGNYKLTVVIDSLIDPASDKVGNCLGLTLLYNVLAQKIGLCTKAVYLEEAFGRESHVLSLVDCNGVTLDIENIFPYGFDFKEHIDNPQRVLWGDKELIADIYHSIGWGLHELGELDDAIHNYTKAIWLNPRYSKAYLNRGVALSMQGRYDEAEIDLHIANE